MDTIRIEDVLVGSKKAQAVGPLSGRRLGDISKEGLVFAIDGAPPDAGEGTGDMRGATPRAASRRLPEVVVQEEGEEW